jgi:hypothetical protein
MEVSEEVLVSDWATGATSAKGTREGAEEAAGAGTLTKIPSRRVHSQGKNPARRIEGRPLGVCWLVDGKAE